MSLTHCARWRTAPTLPLLTLALAAALPGPASAQATTASEAELLRRVDALANELAALKAQLLALQPAPSAALRPAAATAATPQPSSAPRTPPGPTAVAAAPATASTDAGDGPSTVFSGYAELNYNRPRRAAQETQADLRRLVLGWQHRVDADTRIVTEVEVEHAVASSGDVGEVAVEQAYVEQRLSPAWSLRGGLFLVPLGLLNENHEPPAFLGVERNVVETAIIPSTWREGGVQAIGQFDNGLTLQAGVSTGFDLNKWDATSTEGAESPLGSIHQEMAQARGRDLSLFGALIWRGMPGLTLGGGVFSGGATQGRAARSARITLWDLHARWTPGAWDLSALLARGRISGTAALNLPLVGSSTLIPAAFDGGYVQAGYRAWQQGRITLTPFVRWERLSTASAYADLGPGLTPAALPHERVLTLGANLQLAPGVVLKADWQRFALNRDADRSNLGLGWSF